jgi:hypothetical protein
VIKINIAKLYMRYNGKRMVNSLYGRWAGIKSRCNCITNKDYKRYGAKGIKMHQEWADDFYAFVRWAVRNGYRRHLQIDRIDPECGYEPKNCRWVTLSENVKRKSIGNTGRHYKKRIRKLTDDQVRYVFQLRSLGHSKTDIAKLFSVTPQSIHKILIGKSYARFNNKEI